ncbi:MAG: SMC-Scp complex subunit ScpB [Nitrococcus mobilis]|nr:SMC-Scp complex subunit ScpB [Nitrococcus mobilis]
MEPELKYIIEAALLAAGEPLSVERLQRLFPHDQQPGTAAVRRALAALAEDYEHRGIELKEVASGYRIQVRTELASWVAQLWAARPGRYSRALLETLALIAYRQPITRGEIEEIRGVALSTSIMRTLQERGWIHVAGYRPLPGRPALFGTTRAFLDYFNLKSLEELPALTELKDWRDVQPELELCLAQADGDDTVRAAG